MSNVSEHAESIAAYSGFEREWRLLTDRLSAAVKQYGAIIESQWLHGMRDDFFAKYLVSTVGMIIIIGLRVHHLLL